MYPTILRDFHIADVDVINCYPYGSRVYGTASYQSDYDFIIVTKGDVIDRDDLQTSSHNINLSIYSEASFYDKLGRHKIFALECQFLPKDKLLKATHPLPFYLDKSVLRSSISEKASHSWVKAKKKFEVEKDRNVYIAKKSLFHSLRIIDFGIQIATQGKIADYGSCNELWAEIIANPSENWDDYRGRYHDMFNAQMTEFRKVAPKEKGK